MIVKYFHFWDYPTTHIGQFEENEDYRMILKNEIENLSSSDEIVSLDLLGYYTSLEKEGIYPYSKEDIAFLEEKLTYKFPAAFKELLYLFGSLCFYGVHDDLFQGFLSKKASFNKTVKSLLQCQQKLNNLYLKHTNRGITKAFLPIRYNEEGAHFYLISNEIDRGFIHKYDYGNKMPILLEKCLFIENFYKDNDLCASIRETIDKIFCTNFKVAYLLTLLHKEFRSNNLFEKIKIVQTSEKLTLSGKEDAESEISIIVVHDNLLHTNYNHKELGYILLYSYDEIINKRNEIIDELSVLIQSLKLI